MTSPTENYRSYKGLPPLAGLATIEEAALPGLSVEACVERLKRFHNAFVRLHEILTARIPAEPIYELKCAYSHHSYLCAEHVKTIRVRVGEMREPPLGLEAVPHPALGLFFDELLASNDTAEHLLGVYGKAIPALRSAVAAYRNDTNPLTDAPSRRILRFAALELDDMLDYGRKAIDSLIDSRRSDAASEWTSRLDQALAAAGGLDGTGPRSDTPVEPMRSLKPYRFDPIPKRDERFQDLFNQGVNAEAFLYTPEFPAKAKCLMMLFKRIREIDVPEMMASIIHETRDKPWDYYLDMSRQLWDEARHAMMGEVGFARLGVDWTQARITHNWSYRLNTECSPIERHAVLYFIEQGLMTRTGKRYEWEVGRESGIDLMATIQDFDWADEVLHAQIGRDWYIPQIGGRQEAIEFGDKCWSRILSNWRTVLDQGLTRHENWWPAIYEQACARWNETPDPGALAFSETYEGQRADLKNVGASG